MKNTKSRDETSGIHSLSSGLSQKKTTKNRWSHSQSFFDQTDDKNYLKNSFYRHDEKDIIDDQFIETYIPSNKRRDVKDLSKKDYRESTRLFDKSESITPTPSIDSRNKNISKRSKEWETNENNRHKFEESLRSNFSQSTKNIEKLDAMYQKQNEEIGKIEKKIENLRIERQSNELRIADMSQKIEDLEVKNYNYRREVEESSGKINNLMIKIKSLEDQLVECNKELDSTRFAFISYKEKTHDLIEDRESEILELKEQIEETKSFYNSKAASKCRYSKDISVLNKIKSLEEINNELKNEIKLISFEHSKKVKSLKKIIDVMTEKLESAQYANLHSESYSNKSNDNSDIITSSKDFQNIQHNIALNEKINKYINTISEMELKYNSLKFKYDELSSKIKDDNKIEKLKDDHLKEMESQFEEILKKSQEEIDTLKEENRGLKSTVDEFSLKLKILEKKNEELKKLIYISNNNDTSVLENSNPFIELIDVESLSKNDVDSLSKEEKLDLLNSLIINKIHLKNVFLKFITGKNQNSHLLIDVMSKLLNLKPREDKIFRESMKLKMPIK